MEIIFINLIFKQVRKNPYHVKDNDVHDNFSDGKDFELDSNVNRNTATNKAIVIALLSKMNVTRTMKKNETLISVRVISKALFPPHRIDDKLSSRPIKLK